MLRDALPTPASRGIAALLATLCCAGLTVVAFTRPSGHRALPQPPRRLSALSAPADRSVVDRGHTGVIFAHEQVVVSARAPGRLLAVHVRVGDRVVRGQSLATLDTASLGQELVAAQASLRAAGADADKARIEVAQSTDRLGRAEKLASVNPKIEIADGQFQKQTAEAHLALARATIAGARARVEQVAETVKDAEIRSQLDGTVAERYLDAGATVVAGTPLVRVITSDDLWVRFAVPETQAGTVMRGHALAIEVPALGAQVTGHVETIAPEIDPASQMLLVEGKIDAPNGVVAQLASGFEARVRLPAAP